jgi:hypothetical protein
VGTDGAVALVGIEVHAGIIAREAPARSPFSDIEIGV